MSEQEVTASTERKQYQNVVTSENLTEFNLSRLRIPPAKADVEAKPVVVEQKQSKDAESEPETDETDEDSAEQHGKPRKPEHKNGIQKRFSELTGQRNEAQKAAADAKAEAEALRKRIEALESANKPAKADVSAKPKADDFKDPFEYAEALSEWKVDQKLKARDEETQKAKSEAEAAARAKDWERRVKETSKEIDDYEEVMAEANFPLTHELAVAMLESDIGPRIQYYLAKNPDELDALKAMTIGKMLRSFGKLEAKLEREARKAEPEETKPVAPIKRAVAAAPEPITPIKTAGSTAGASLVGSDGVFTGSFQQYRAARKAGKIK